MKFKYNKEDDVLLIELNDKKIDYAEQTGNFIVHFSPDRQATVIEILDATVFLKQAVREFPKKVLDTVIPTFPQVANKVK